MRQVLPPLTLSIFCARFLFQCAFFTAGVALTYACSSKTKMEHIQHVVYINLDRRTDRNAEMLEQLALAGVGTPGDGKVERFPGVAHEYGPAGCNASHAAALNMAADNGWANVMILEDDFNFKYTGDELQRRLAHFFTTVDAEGKEWDMVLLTGHCTTMSASVDEFLGLCSASGSAAGYIVHQRAMRKLANLIGGAVAPLAATRRPVDFANDQVWAAVMRDGRTYFFKDVLGYQRPSYSDLECRLVNYANVCGMRR